MEKSRSVICFGLSCQWDNKYRNASVSRCEEIPLCAREPTPTHPYTHARATTLSAPPCLGYLGRCLGRGLGMLSAQPPVALLQLPPVEPGQVYRRVCCTRKFVHQVVGTAIGCSAVHVVVGWLVATQFGKESFWKAADACLVMPGNQEKPRGVALVSEGIESCNEFSAIPKGSKICSWWLPL